MQSLFYNWIFASLEKYHTCSYLLSDYINRPFTIAWHICTWPNPILYFTYDCEETGQEVYIYYIV
jgi:hypothetical protein